MKNKANLIYNDVLPIAMLGFAIYRWNHELRTFWILMFAFWMAKQARMHAAHYKQTQRIY